MSEKDCGFRLWDKKAGRFFEPTYEANNGRLEEVLMSQGGRLIKRTIDGVFDESMFPGRFVFSEKTGLKTQDGQDVFDEDIVVAQDIPSDVEQPNRRPNELIVDRVNWELGAWRLGNYDGTLADFILVRVEGNTFEKPWPINL